MNTEQEINEQFEANGEQLTPELAAKLIDLEMSALNGDTAAQPAENGGVPDTTQAQGTPEAGQVAKPAAQTTATVNEADLNANNAVVVAKDGKHTIPFEKLAESRNEAKEWRERYEQQQQELAALRTQAANPQPTQAEQNLATAEAAIQASGNDQSMIELFGDFSEQAIAKGVHALVQQQVASAVQASVQGALNSALAPLQQQQAMTAQEQHFKAIYEAHPDLDSITESQQFGGWIDQQPSYVRDGINRVLAQGTAQEVNEVVTNYKTANNLTVQAANVNANAIKEAAQQAVNKAQSQVPHSVSDLPAGTPAAVSREDRLAALTPAQLLEEMSSWTSEQIDAYTLRNA